LLLEAKKKLPYFKQGKLCKGKVNIAYDDSNWKLWHERLRHMSEKRLPILARKDILLNIKGKSPAPCIDCLVGKQHRVTFHKNVRPTTRKHMLDLVHSDVYYMIEKSLGRSLYFVTFIDDHKERFRSLC